MTRKEKIIAVTIAVFGISGIGYLVWTLVSMPDFFRDLYVQWDTAEMIIRHHREHKQLPNGWDDLRATYGDGSGFRGPRNFEALSQKTIVDFARLAEFERLAQSTSAVTSLPEIVRPRSGVQSHWSGAEPNKLIYNYFRDLIERSEESTEAAKPSQND